jgi:predicted RNA-binding Zn-ribbon protein involved in translation (DUF1610 family)
MFKEHNKITYGYVVQRYITLPDGTMICQDQEFIAGDPVEYENMDSGAIEVDVDKEVYCPFEMKQPKQIPDEKDAVKFVCPDCGDNRLEAVMDGSHTTIIEGMFKSGSIEYGDTASAGDLDRFQCVKCGHVIEFEPDDIIKDEEELIEWLKKNCEQK